MFSLLGKLHSHILALEKSTSISFMKKIYGLIAAILLPFIGISQCTTTNATSCVCLDLTQSNCDLLPDIKLGPPPFYAQGNNGIIEYPQICNPPCQGNDGRLRISVSTPNIGVGPLTVRTTTTFVCGQDTFYGASPGICPNGDPPKQLIVQRVYHKNGNTMTYYDRAAGSMTYHPTHGHMHVDDWGIYTLRDNNGDPDPLNWPIIGTGAKLAFCLMDYGSCSTYNGHCLDDNGNVLVNGNFPNWGLGGGNYNCSATEQGISSGYTDIYYQYLDGMWINLPPGLCNGQYWIVVQIDPYDYFLESNENNNVYAFPYALTQQNSGGTASITAIGPTTICPGETTTLSANSGTSYLWSNGATTQTILVNTAGTYTVTVSSACGTATSQPVSVSLTSTQPPSTTDDSVCFVGSGILTASGTGDINWYDAQTGGNLVGTGSSFTTPVLTSSTTYYADNTDTFLGPVNFAPPHNNLIGNGGNHTDPTRYLIFNALTDLTLVSVKVYAQGAGNRIIELRDNNNAVLQSVTAFVPDGESRITLNFNIMAGTNYRLGTGNTPDMFRNNSGVQYPYDVNGFVSITSSSAGAQFYYFFYDWEVKGPDMVCTSLRSPATMHVQNCLGIDENETSLIASLFPNPNKGLLSVQLKNTANADIKLSITDLSGKIVMQQSFSKVAAGFNTSLNLEGTASGTYLLKAAVNGTESIQKFTIIE
ncbi:MAG: T9SS type A sorting domain-containing protein [Bacteroidia bacterium]|nr:T9SS type A sorting domain-containing protein [Bacteroidia bacterium]